MADTAAMTKAEAGARRSHALANDVLAMLKQREVDMTDALHGLSTVLGTLIGRLSSDHDHMARGVGIATDHVAKVAEAAFEQQAAEDIAALLCAQPEGSA